MSRDGKPHELLEIPDGFYLIGCLEDKENANVLKWLGASVGGVEKITHIAPLTTTMRLSRRLLCRNRQPESARERPR